MPSTRTFLRGQLIYQYSGLYDGPSSYKTCRHANRENEVFKIGTKDLITYIVQGSANSALMLKLHVVAIYDQRMYLCCILRQTNKRRRRKWWYTWLSRHTQTDLIQQILIECPCRKLWDGRNQIKLTYVPRYEAYEGSDYHAARYPRELTSRGYVNPICTKIVKILLKHRYFQCLRKGDRIKQPSPRN
jgi:hypothetical protein